MNNDRFYAVALWNRLACTGECYSIWVTLYELSHAMVSLPPQYRELVYVKFKFGLAIIAVPPSEFVAIEQVLRNVGLKPASLTIHSDSTAQLEPLVSERSD